MGNRSSGARLRVSFGFSWISLVGLLVLTGCPPTIDPFANPGRGFLAACRPWQRKVCVGQCADVTTRVGAPCDFDPCNPQNLGVPLVCGPNMRCQPCGDTSSCLPNMGTCQSIAPLDGALASPYCDPMQPLGSANSACTQQPFQHCRPASCFAAGVPNAPNAPGMCIGAITEGATCDGEWTGVVAGGAAQPCRACGPGMVCMRRLDGATGRVCMRRCDSAVGGLNACQPPQTLAATAAGPPISYDYRCEPHLRTSGNPLSGLVNVCVRDSPHGETCAPPASYETRSVLDTVARAEWCPAADRRPDGTCRLPPDARPSRYAYVDTSTRVYTPAESPVAGSPADNVNPCRLNNDACRADNAAAAPNGLNISFGQFRCCRAPGQGCDQDRDCCNTGSAPSRCVPVEPVGQTGAPTSPQRVCRAGCDPGIAEDFSLLSAVANPIPVALRCPSGTECTAMAGSELVASPWPFPVTPTFGAPFRQTERATVCMPCGQEGERCCSGRDNKHAPSCGASMVSAPFVGVSPTGPIGDVPPTAFGGVITPNLVCVANVCLDRRFADSIDVTGIPTPGPRCGDLGEICCPAAIGASGFVHTPVGSPDSDVVIPQGSRCRAGGICGPQGTCEPCGGPNQMCCDLDLANTFNRIRGASGAQPLPPLTPIQDFVNISNPLFAGLPAEQRRMVDLVEEPLFCGATVPAFALSPRRCVPGFACTTAQLLPRHNPATSGGGGQPDVTCQACGQSAGQPCCDGQWCRDTGAGVRLVCNGSTCEGCGGCDQPACNNQCGSAQCQPPLVVAAGLCKLQIMGEFVNCP